mgnify:CR=1 FL=1
MNRGVRTTCGGAADKRSFLLREKMAAATAVVCQILIKFSFSLQESSLAIGPVCFIMK